MDKYLIKSSASQTEDKQRNKRKYKEFGFIANETEVPFCVVCKKKHSNEVLVPSKIKNRPHKSQFFFFFCIKQNLIFLSIFKCAANNS